MGWYVSSQESKNRGEEKFCAAAEITLTMHSQRHSLSAKAAPTILQAAAVVGAAAAVAAVEEAAAVEAAAAVEGIAFNAVP